MSASTGRDETLLALDRAFDGAPVVLLHAWAGGGKTATAVEFARWYALTGAAQDVLFTSFTRHLPLARLLDQICDRFDAALAQAGVDWATLADAERREVALHVLAQVSIPARAHQHRAQPVQHRPRGRVGVTPG